MRHRDIMKHVLSRELFTLTTMHECSSLDSRSEIEFQ